MGRYGNRIILDDDDDELDEEGYNLSDMEALDEDYEDLTDENGNWLIAIIRYRRIAIATKPKIKFKVCSYIINIMMENRMNRCHT